MPAISTTPTRPRRPLAAAALGITAAGLVACDPSPIPDDPDTAWLRIDVGPTGDARAELSLASDLAESLLPTAQRLSRSLFSTDDSTDPTVPTVPTVGIDGNGGGYDIAVISAPGAYRRGDDPRLSIAVTDDAVEALEDLGVTTLDVSFCAPFVRYEIGSSPPMASNETRCASWRVDTFFGTLDATMVLHPDTGRWYRSVVLTVVAGVSTAAAVFCAGRRWSTNLHRRVAIATTAAPGSAALAIGVVTQAAAPHGDNLGVTGDLDGLPLVVATWAPVVLIPLGLACTVLVVVHLIPRARRPQSVPLP